VCFQTLSYIYHCSQSQTYLMSAWTQRPIRGIRSTLKASHFLHFCTHLVSKSVLLTTLLVCICCYFWKCPLVTTVTTSAESIIELKAFYNFNSITWILEKCWSDILKEAIQPIQEISVKCYVRGYHACWVFSYMIELQWRKKVCMFVHGMWTEVAVTLSKVYLGFRI